MAREIERLNPHAVARQHQTPVRFGPQGYREHAAQAGEGGGLPFPERGQHNLGVGLRVEAVAAALQLVAQHRVVIDFAVENDCRVAVFRDDRLVTRVQAHDFQPGRAERNQAPFEHAAVLRSPMRQRSDDGVNALAVGSESAARKSCDSTQTEFPFDKEDARPTLR